MLRTTLPLLSLLAVASACVESEPPTIKVIDRDGDGFAEGADDCDDGNPSVNVEAPEVCDGVDNNCDGFTDDADPALDTRTATPFYADTDRDGHGDPGAEVLACAAPSGHVDAAYADDCDDTDDTVSPEATETCDGLDNDCDGDIDDADTEVSGAPRWYRDDDRDAFGDNTDFVDACEAPTGFTAVDGDCDDGDDARHPEATEVCDDIDNDCDDLIDDEDSSLDATSRSDFYADDDGDGYGDPSDVRPACEVADGIVDNSDDCDDNDATISPDATEVCDEVDNDCDGDVDDADADVDTSTGTTFYADRDGDGEGDAFTTTAACALPSGFVESDTDCDDADATRNSTTAWYPDADTDAYGDTSATATVQCLNPGTGFVLNALDCDDSNGAINPGEAEVCDEVDNDCNGTIDDGVTETFYADTDADAYGDPASTVEACTAPSGHVDNSDDCDDTDDTINPDTEWYLDADSDGYGGVSSTTQCTQPSSAYTRTDGDCDDADATSFPGGTEVCDGADNNCDATIDEGVTTTYFRDTDGDGYGVASSTTEDCSVPAGYAATDDDCDDTDTAVNPGATEVCNDTDDDCDGDVDDSDSSLDTTTATTWFADADTDGDGDPASTTLTCEVPTGYVGNSDDCDDTDGALNTATVWYLDADSDGYGDDGSTVTQCSQPTTAYSLAGGDCDTTDATVYPGATEVCDGTDQDCDGTADNGVTTDFFPDLDADGYGDSAATATAACAAPSGYVADGTDCDDTSDLVYPSATELCDGVQNDCADTTWTDDGGLVSSYDTALETWSDETGTWAAGTSLSPAAVTVTDASTLNVCAGTWYVALDAQADLDLVGVGGESAVLLDGAGLVTPVSVTGSGLLVTVDGLTLQNGEATNTNASWPAYWPASTTQIGGNLYCQDSTLGIYNTTLTGGNAIVAGNLGTIDCDVDMDTVTVTNGTAFYSTGVELFNGTTTSTNLLIDGNDAVYDGGGIYLGGPTGIHVLTDSTVSNNTAGQYAGGLRILDAVSVSLSGLTVEDNTATDYGAGMYIANFTADPTVDIDTSTFEGNVASDVGGAIYLEDGDLTVDTCDFTSNTGTNGGGALTAMGGTDSIIADSTFTSNTGGYGGAIGAYGDTLSIDGSTFSSNHATTVAGAINVQGGHLDLTDSDVTDNTSDNSNGGIRFNQSGTTGTIDGVLFEGNEGLNSTSNGGGAALVLRYGVTVDITDSDFIDNVSTLTSGTSYGGGAIWAWTSTSQPRNTLTLYSVTATGNESSQSGGFMYGRLTDITMGNVDIDSNTALTTGGGAMNLSACTLSISNSSVTNNTAATLGGGIYASSSITLTATSVDIYGNSPDDTYMGNAADSDTWGVNSTFTCSTTAGCN